MPSAARKIMRKNICLALRSREPNRSNYRNNNQYHRYYKREYSETPERAIFSAYERFVPRPSEYVIRKIRPGRSDSRQGKFPGAVSDFLRDSNNAAASFASKLRGSFREKVGNVSSDFEKTVDPIRESGRSIRTGIDIGAA